MRCFNRNFYAYEGQAESKFMRAQYFQGWSISCCSSRVIYHLTTGRHATQSARCIHCVTVAFICHPFSG